MWPEPRTPWPQGREDSGEGSRSRTQSFCGDSQSKSESRFYGLRSFWHDPLFPISRCRSCYRIPRLHFADAGRVRKSCEPARTCFSGRLVGSTGCRLFKPFQTACGGETCSARFADNMVLLWSSHCPHGRLVLNSNDTAISSNSAVGTGHRIHRFRELSATAGWQHCDLDLSKRHNAVCALSGWHRHARTLPRPGSMARHQCPEFNSSILALSYSGRVCGLGTSRIPSQRCSPFACRGRRVSIQVPALRLIKDVFIRRIRMGQGPLLLLFRKGCANIA